MISLNRGRREHPVDRATRWALTALALVVVAVFFALVGVLISHSTLAFQHAGASLVTGPLWDPDHDLYGGWPFIFGTLFSSAIALALAVPIGFAVALFLTELSPLWLRTPLGVLVELLAGVPSIVFGMWGIIVLGPLMRTSIVPAISSKLGWIPFFATGRGVTGQTGFFVAGVVLTIMILPTITAIARDSLLAVPQLEREAAYALGATRWEVARTAVKTAKAGLFAAATLGLGRALGETMAVYFVIGSSPTTALRLFANGETIATSLALQIPEATEPVLVSALIALATILMALTLVVNLGARLIIERPWRRHAS